MKPKSQLFMILLITTAVHLCSASSFAQQPFCQLEKLDGTGTVDFNSLPGRYIYLDFWASWCAPCKESFAFLNSIKTRFSPKDITVIGINEDKNPNDAAVFLKNNPANFIVVSDKDSACAKAMKLQGMPSMYIITKEGNIVDMHRGFRPSDVETISDEIHRLLH